MLLIASTCTLIESIKKTLSLYYFLTLLYLYRCLNMANGPNLLLKTNVITSILYIYIYFQDVV